MTLFLIATILLISCYVALKDPYLILLLSLVAIPWQGIDVDVGLRVTLYLVLFLPLVVFYGFSSFSRAGTKVRIVQIIFIYSLILGIMMLPFLPNSLVPGGESRQPISRAISQMFIFYVLISPIFIIPRLVRDNLQIKKLASAYIYSCVALSILGFMQLLFWYYTGNDPLPIGFVDQILGGAADIRSGKFDHDLFNIYRLSSLGGEPKNAGASLFVALVLMQSKRGVFTQKEFIIWLILFIAMLLTFSSMAILLWVGASFVQSVIYPFKNVNSNKYINIGIFISIIFITLYILDFFQSFLDILGARTVDRILDQEEGGGYLEDFNLTIVNFLIDNPLFIITGTGVGNAHLFSQSYIPEYARYYMQEGVYVAKSLLIKWISELGIISFTFFVAWILMFFKKSVNYHKKISGRFGASALLRFGIPLFLSTLLSNYIATQFFIFLGVALASLNYKKEPTL